MNSNPFCCSITIGEQNSRNNNPITRLEHIENTTIPHRLLTIRHVDDNRIFTSYTSTSGFDTIAIVYPLPRAAPDCRDAGGVDAAGYSLELDTRTNECRAIREAGPRQPSPTIQPGATLDERLQLI